MLDKKSLLVFGLLRWTNQIEFAEGKTYESKAWSWISVKKDGTGVADEEYLYWRPIEDSTLPPSQLLFEFWQAYAIAMRAVAVIIAIFPSR